jgi:hypothetical protein
LTARTPQSIAKILSPHSSEIHHEIILFGIILASSTLFLVQLCAQSFLRQLDQTDWWNRMVAHHTRNYQ